MMEAIAGNRGRRQSRPTAALGFFDNERMDIDQATPELRRDLVRDTQKEVARNEQIDAYLRDLLLAQPSRFRGPMVSLKPFRNYTDGQREVVQTRTRDYTTRPAVKSKPTRKAAGRNATGKAGAARGAPLGAGAGGGSGGSDDDEDKNRRKRPPPKDASDSPRRRKKGKGGKDNDSEGNDNGQADADGKSAAKNEPSLGQPEQRRNRLGGLLTLPARDDATRTAPGGGSHPNDDDASSKSKDGDGRRPKTSPVRKGRVQGPSRRGPFQQESSESQRDLQRSPDRQAPHSQRSLPGYKDDDETNGPAAPTLERPKTPETTEQALERVQAELSMREMLTLHDILIGDPSIHIKKYIIDALSRSIEPSRKAESVNMIRQLSKVYGDGSIWADAGDIENYLTFGIDEEEMWNDRSDEVEDEAELETIEVQHSGPRWDPKWSRVAKQIDRVEAVNVLYRKAKSIAQKSANQDLHVKPNDVSGRTPEHYLADLEAVVALKERELVKGTWGIYAERLTRDYDITGGLAAKLHAKSVELETSMQQYDDKAKCPKEEASRIAWLYVADKGEDKRASVRAKARFDDLVSAATTMCEDGQILLPPEWGEDLSLEEYCEEMTNAFDHHRTMSIKDSRTAWEHAIKVARATGDETTESDLMAGLQQLNKHVAAGGHPFCIKTWDREQVPLTPSPPGSPATLAQDIGFDGERAQLGDVGDWSFARIIGSGGFGNVSLWERSDPTGTITDRIAIKETYLGPLPPNKTRDQWTSGRYWHGEIHNRYPQEAALMLYLNSLSNSENIVHCRAYASYDVKKMFRLYLEFCDYGDLQSLIQTQAERNFMFSARVLWPIFESLTAALCIMQLGCLPPSPPPQTHDAVIHQDIKPANIFLKSRTDANWRDIPYESVLGDFGLAQLQSDPDCILPGTGTKGYKSPEQYIYPEDHPRYGENIVGPHSDIWVVGRVMLSLMDLEVKVRDLGEFRFGDGEEEEVVEFKQGEYWLKREERLWELVHLCLRKEPEDRIGIEQLWEEVREVVGRMDDREGYEDGFEGGETPIVDGGYDGLAR